MMRKMTKQVMVATALAILAALPAVAQLNEDAVEFDEHLGEFVPGDITLRDENGQPVLLSEFVDRPTIVSMVYFECPGICTPLLNEVADILGKSNLDPSKQPFQLMSVSFDGVSASCAISCGASSRTEQTAANRLLILIMGDIPMVVCDWLSERAWSVPGSTRQWPSTQQSSKLGGRLLLSNNSGFYHMPFATVAE